MMTLWSQAGPRKGARSTSNQEQGILTGPFRKRKSQKLTKEEMELAKEEMELTKEETELEKKTEGRKASMEQWKQVTKERRKHRMQEM